MSERSLRFILDDVLTAMRKIGSFTSGMTYAEFLDDERTYDAVIRNFMIIGEAVNRIPRDVLETRTSIPWRQIIGLRNRIVHEYFDVDSGIIWFIITNQLPQLEQAILSLLDSEGHE